MPKFDAVVAMNVPIYARVVVNAETPEAAIEKLRDLAVKDFDGVNFDPAEATMGTDHRVLFLSEHGIMKDGRDREVYFEDLDLTKENKIYEVIGVEELRLRMRLQSEESAP